MRQAGILVVEDESVVASDIQETLEELGYSVVGIVASGEAAVRQAESMKPDLILMDIVLQGTISGIEAAAQIRETTHIPIVFLSAHGDNETLQRVQGTDPFGFLIKPFEERQLHTTIEMALYKSDMERKLAESRQWLSGTLDGLGEAVIAVDTGNNIRFLNHIAGRLVGVDPEQACDQPLQQMVQIVNSRDRNADTDVLAKAIMDGAIVSFPEDSYCLSRNGNKVPIDGTATPIRTPQGVITGAVLAFRDMTEPRRAGRVLRESEQRFRTLAETTPAGILISEGRIFRYVNPAAERMMGFSKERLLSMGIHNLLAEESGLEFLERFDAWMESHETLLHDELHIVTESGERRWIDVTIGSVNLTGRFAALWTAFDITVRKQAEDKIREQAALLNVTQDAIAVRDLDGKILFWNKGSERLYGWQVGEALGKNIGPLLHKRESTEWIEAYRGVVAKGEWIGELRHVTKDGKEVYVQSRWTLMRGSDGNPESILMVNTDITDRKQLEAQFRRAQRLEIIGTLAGGIAHDLNNVLAPISMSLSLLRKRMTDDKTQKILSTLESSVHRGSDIVRQVLTFARGAEGDRVLMQVKHVIREVEKITRETFSRAIDIRSDLPRDLWKIRGDGTQLHQVLMNLCVNARDAMPEGGLLQMRAENMLVDEEIARKHLDAKPGPHVVISVTDSGTGIPPEIVDQIFDPFFTTKEVGKGTGLGLSTVLGIVKGHGGFVTVSSQAGRGTTFTVHVPAEPGDTEEEQIVVHDRAPEGQGEHILIVDDEASVREIAKEALEAHGYNVVVARDGTEAIALFAQQRDKIAAVLTDMIMPYMDGPSTIRALRRIDPHVRVIGATGLAHRDQFTEVRKETQAFLQKPFSTDLLLKTLDTVLRAN